MIFSKERAIFIESTKQHPMILLKDVCRDQWSWDEQDYFESFLSENPKWKSAEVISDQIDDNFPTYYFYDIQFLVKLGKRHYNLIISNRTHTFPGRKQKLGVIFKRFYLSGEKPIRRNTKCFVDREYIHKHIKNTERLSFKDDCQIQTFAICLDISYKEAYNILSQEGWTEDSTNMTRMRWERALKKLGYSFPDVWKRWKEDKGMTIATLVDKLPKMGVFVITVTNHILCVIDGVMYDSNCTEPYKRVSTINQILKS